jgi:hypothetical protein
MAPNDSNETVFLTEYKPIASNNLGFLVVGDEAKICPICDEEKNQFGECDCSIDPGKIVFEVRTALSPAQESSPCMIKKNRVEEDCDCCWFRQNCSTCLA